MNPITESYSIVSQLLSSWVDDIVPKQIHVAENAHLGDLISHIYHENYKVKQGKCYQQHSSNLCGYHAIFNSICFLQLLKGGHCEYQIDKCSNFWRLKLHVQKLLTEHKKSKALPDQWPWRENDIKNGDFERVYHQICSQNMKVFSIFHHQDSFQYLNHTWSFQYSNLLLDEDSRQRLSSKITKFRQHSSAKPIVLHLMLGITTHWLVFFAVKINSKVDYWFFDSENDSYLDLDQQGIKNFIQKQSIQAVKFGKKEYTSFEKETYIVCVKDIQLSLRLIMQCLEGETTLQSYHYNRKFSIFAKKLSKAMNVDATEVSNVIREYQFNITSFLIEPIQWQLLNTQNADLLRKIVQYASENKNQSEQLRYLDELSQIQCGQ